MSRGYVRVWTILALLLLILGGVARWPWPNVNPDALSRFFALPEPLRLLPAEQEQAFSLVRAVLPLEATWEVPTDVPPEFTDLFRERDVRPVWVTLYLEGVQPARGQASELNLYRSLRVATTRALQSSPDAAVLRQRASEVALQLDFWQSEAPLLSRSWPYLSFAVEPGVDGLHLIRSSGGVRRETWQLPTDVVTQGLLTPRVQGRERSVERLLERASQRVGLRADQWKRDASLQLQRFRTLSSVSHKIDAPIEPFYRGNVLLKSPALTAARIQAGIELGVDWLMRQARPDGTFQYEYLPNADRAPDTYNMVRHAGTVFGLMSLYRFYGDEKYLNMAAHAFPPLERNLSAPEGESALRAIREGRGYPTGAAALALLALVAQPPHLRSEQFEENLEGLGQFLLKMIDRHGRVFEGYGAAKAHDEVQQEPLYYPGETMLALTQLYALTGELRWIEAAEQIAAAQRRQQLPLREPDHWVIQGLAQLYFLGRGVEYGETCLAWARIYLRSQYPPNHPPFPDYMGAWRRDLDVPRTTRAGARSEALSAAVRVAWQLKIAALDLEEALLFAARHQLEQQLRPENAFFFPRPTQTYGGFRAGLVDNHLRIDFNQHALVGLLGALEVAHRREARPAFWRPVSLVPLKRSPAVPSP